MENKKDNFIEEKIEPNPRGRTRHLLLSLLLVLVVVGSFLGGFFFGDYYKKSDTNRLISELLQIIEANAKTEEGEEELSSDEIAQKLVQTILAEDPYAQYYSASEYEALKSETGGTYNGIGVSFLVTADDATTLSTINKVIWNSPAEEAGILAGDIIIAGKLETDAEYTDFTNNVEVRNFLADCEFNKTLKLKIVRKAEVLEISVAKKQYTVAYVKYYDSQTEMSFKSVEGSLTLEKSENALGAKTTLDEKTAYIMLSQFEGGADTQFAMAMEYMKERGRTKLILDLCDNGGGSMNILQNIASYLIYNNGDAVSRIAYAHENDRKTDFTTSSNLFNTEIEKIVVMANKNTASASEALIGAMAYDGVHTGGKFTLDNLVVAYNSSREDYSTYGKGIMQTIYQLKNGGALKLTTAKLYQPDDVTTIHGVGIKATLSQNCVADKTQAEARAIEMTKSGS